MAELEEEGINREGEEEDDAGDVGGEAKEEGKDEHDEVPRKRLLNEEGATPEASEDGDGEEEGEEADKEIIMDFGEAGIDGGAVGG